MIGFWLISKLTKINADIFFTDQVLQMTANSIEILNGDNQTMHQKKKVISFRSVDLTSGLVCEWYGHDSNLCRPTNALKGADKEEKTLQLE